MSASQPKRMDDLHMSSAQFDRLMRKALQVAPEQPPQPTPRAKVTKSRKLDTKTQRK